MNKKVKMIFYILGGVFIALSIFICLLKIPILFIIMFVMGIVFIALPELIENKKRNGKFRKQKDYDNELTTQEIDLYDMIDELDDKE